MIKIKSEVQIKTKMYFEGFQIYLGLKHLMIKKGSSILN